MVALLLGPWQASGSFVECTLEFALAIRLEEIDPMELGESAGHVAFF